MIQNDSELYIVIAFFKKRFNIFLKNYKAFLNFIFSIKYENHLHYHNHYHQNITAI